MEHDQQRDLLGLRHLPASHVSNQWDTDQASGGLGAAAAGSSQHRPPGELLALLQEACRLDTAGGMHFWEVARSLRGGSRGRCGVFEEAFFAFIQQRHAAAPDADARLELEHLQARLSNPLLRQAAPFEF
ncbi:hypothetical protein WJX81_000467 [Elliptochloris bilobata]|uniref:Uncharacterized protein n=1 Tax=Elliptochloris bilobata TaxID=381761 RepID=A0AAW1QIU2_9CHLO